MIQYRIFSGKDCPESLFRFRYKIYVEEMNRRQRYACHDTKTIIDPLDATARQVVAFSDGEIIACIRANLLREGAVGPYHAFYELDRLSPEERQASSICTRLMVTPEWRRTTVSIDIFLRLYEFALSHGVRSSYIDCNAHLLRFFLKFGYEKLFVKTHEEYGEVTVMRLDHYDFDRIVAINSPFAAIAAEAAARERAQGLPELVAS